VLADSPAVDDKLPLWLWEILSMATAARITTDESLDIMRRIEPMLGDIRAELKEVRAEQQAMRIEQQGIRSEQQGIRGELKEINTELHRNGERLAALEGRVSQLPTLWTLASLIFAIFGFAFLLLRFAAPVSHS
jgi:predicted nuclease with TOPRIM domain